jgi:hypothetical protein
MAANEETAARPSLHPIGTLYGYWAFNFMIEIARAIVDDVVDRPHRFQAVPDQLAGLTGFRSLLGSHPEWPDSQQRLALFRPLGDVCLAAVPLREAALAHVETGTEVNKTLLVDAFGDAARSFRDQMKNVEGQPVEISIRQIGAIFTNAIQLLQNDALMRVFGLPSAPTDDSWPIAASSKRTGINLAGELIRLLDAGNAARMLVGGPTRELDGPHAQKRKPIKVSMNQNKFVHLQQAAWYGALSISGAMTVDEQDDLTRLIGHTYKWTKALQHLVPDVVRAWKDPDYRLRLTDLEWGMIEPHPSSTISVPLLGGGNLMRYQTATLRGEVCCCTGDLPCPASTNCVWSPNPSCINCPTLLAAVGCAAALPF